MSLSAFLHTRYGRGFASRDEIKAHHDAAFRRFRAKVMPRSPFYRDMTGLPLAQLPRMNKARLMEEFSAINTCGIDRDQAMQIALRAETSRDFSPLIGGISVGLSTGTSGQRGLFLATPGERRLWAAIMLGRYWPQLWRRQRVAFFMRADNALYRSMSNLLVRFEFFDLLAPFDEHLSRFAALDPTVLVAPAQVLAALARQHIAGRIALSPQRIISVAETLSPDDATLIRHTFGISADQVYQATEGVLAMTCPQGQLHLNERWLRVDRDVIDPATGAFCPIIHDFTRKSLPILNYRLDDVLIPDPTPCACGCASQRIARIEGREDDILWWDSAQGPRLITSEAIRTTIACLPQKLRDYGIVQRGKALHIWLDAAEAGAENALRDQLLNLGSRLKCRPPEFVFHTGSPPEIGAKRRRIRVEKSPHTDELQT